MSTNYNKIMSLMTPEHLAKLLAKSSDYCPTPDRKCDNRCYKCYLDWLNKSFDFTKTDENAKMSAEIIPFKTVFYKCHLGIVTDESFRWGGIERLFNETIAFWKENDEEHFTECACCGRPFKDDEFPYSNFFEQSDGSRLAIICKECAYKISPFVIEADGTKYVSTTYKKEG